jgi:transcriptional regulator with XRE-family HTH domain
MGMTQVDIAKAVGLDVSSVNKILNETPGPRFKPGTISKVFRVAEKMGYNFNRPTKERALKVLLKMYREHKCPGCSACFDTEKLLKQLRRI